MYNQSQDYVNAKAQAANCEIYAMAYSQILIRRLVAEQPEFLDEAGVSKNELIAHLTNNMCYPYTKVKSRMFRERTVEIKAQ